MFCYLGVILSFGISLTLFACGWLDVQNYFYAPIVLLIGFYTVYSVLTDKEYYLPIMVEQVYQNVTSLTLHLHDPTTVWTLSSTLWTITVLAWLIDSNNGTIGYLWKSWFTKARFRDMDPYPMHWVVVLMCYLPFIRWANQFVPFPALPANSEPLLHAGFNTALEVLLVVFLVMYILSGCALWFSTSNLCYKKIQTRGPYAIVRHPATTCKLVYFFLAFFRYRAAYTLIGFLCYGFWLTIYVCRALVEERFLRRFPEYRDYMKKTRHRFIPGVC